MSTIHVTFSNIFRTNSKGKWLIKNEYKITSKNLFWMKYKSSDSYSRHPYHFVTWAVKQLLVNPIIKKVKELVVYT